MRAEHHQRRRRELAGWPVTVTSYRLGERYVCEIESAGARLARAEGPTREASEDQALRSAAARLGRTRVFAQP